MDCLFSLEETAEVCTEYNFPLKKPLAWWRNALVSMESTAIVEQALTSRVYSAHCCSSYGLQGVSNPESPEEYVETA